jgi:hypothetical protein
MRRDRVGGHKLIRFNLGLSLASSHYINIEPYVVNIYALAVDGNCYLRPLSLPGINQAINVVGLRLAVVSIQRPGQLGKD